ncbi:DNA alkylation repair protein, partial [Terrabacter terrae]|uniref:DNA alkylation repair protein n=1 Tax=Terrabacter terrae TaxID=318434 RepID=UPI0031D4FF3B
MSEGAHHELVAAVSAALSGRAAPERAAGQQRYMKSAMPYFGLTSPQLKATLTPLLRDPALSMRSRAQWEATIRALWDGATHREQWYAAIALARHRPYRAWVDSDAMPLWESLVRTGAWWDVVDDIATHLVRDTLLA